MEVEVPSLGPNPCKATVDKFGVLSSMRIGVQQAQPGKLDILRLILYFKDFD